MIAALFGGALLGIVGALLAIPVAAAIALIIREVVLPARSALTLGDCGDELRHGRLNASGCSTALR